MAQERPAEELAPRPPGRGASWPFPFPPEPLKTTTFLKLYQRLVLKELASSPGTNRLHGGTEQPLFPLDRWGKCGPRH